MDLNVLGNYNSSICLALRSGNRFASLALSIATSGGGSGREVALFVAQLYVMSLANTSSVLLARTFRFQLAATTLRERHKENGPEEAEDDAEDTEDTED